MKREIGLLEWVQNSMCGVRTFWWIPLGVAETECRRIDTRAREHGPQVKMHHLMKQVKDVTKSLQPISQSASDTNSNAKRRIPLIAEPVGACSVITWTLRASVENAPSDA